MAVCSGTGNTNFDFGDLKGDLHFYHEVQLGKHPWVSEVVLEVKCLFSEM